MDATFYNFSKRVNSTKVPAIAGTTFNVTLKQPTSMNNPVIRLNADTFNFSYAQFNGSYYFVSDIMSIRNNLWDVYLTRDVLATYKSQILAQSMYVLRSYSQYDGYIIDNKYPAKVDYTIDETETTAPWDSIDFSGGTYICGIVGSALSGSVGSVTYWALDRSELRQLLVNLLSSISVYHVSIDELSENLQKMLFNPLQYFVSCIWFPFNKTAFSGSDGVEIKYGWWTLPQTAKLLSSTTPIHKTSYLQALPHPQTIRGSYLNAPPYTRKFVRFLPFGTFEVDPQFFPSNTTIILYTSVDVITGVGVLRVAKEAGEDWRSYQTIQAQVGVPIQLSQISNNFQAITSGITSLASGAAAGALLGGGIGAAVGAFASIGNAASAFVPQLQSSGINGGLSGLDTDITLTHYFSIIADEDLINNGRPLCKFVQLGSLSGFTVCESGELNIECMDKEREQIAAYLTEGFYIE